MSEVTREAMSQASTRPMAAKPVKDRTNLWLAIFAVVIIGAAIFGGYWLAVQQSEQPVIQGQEEPVKTTKATPTPTPTMEERVERAKEEEEILPDPEPVVPSLNRDTGVDLHVQPVGAKISLDGYYVGVAPLKLRNLIPGTHSIAIEDGEDYEGKTLTISLESGQSKVLEVTLDSAQGADKKADRSSTRRAKTKSKPLSKTGKSANPASKPAASVSLGNLMLGSKPPCSISIDGKNTKLLTPQRSIQLPEGLHRVVLSNKEQGIRKSFKVRIKAGATTRAILDLRTNQ